MHDTKHLSPGFGQDWCFIFFLLFPQFLSHVGPIYFTRGILLLFYFLGILMSNKPFFKAFCFSLDFSESKKTNGNYDQAFEAIREKTVKWIAPLLGGLLGGRPLDVVVQDALKGYVTAPDPVQMIVISVTGTERSDATLTFTANALDVDGNKHALIPLTTLHVLQPKQISITEELIYA